MAEQDAGRPSRAPAPSTALGAAQCLPESRTSALASIAASAELPVRNGTARADILRLALSDDAYTIQ